MSNVQFEESWSKKDNYNLNPETGLSKILINYGIVKSQKSAQIFMIFLIIIFFSISAYLLFVNFIQPNLISKRNTERPPIQDLIQKKINNN